MRNFVLRLIVNAIALAVTAALLPGIHIRDDSIGTLLIVAFIFGVVNAIIKPILIILSCPLVILTLGLFLLVVNGIMLLITDAIAGNRLEIDTFWWAVLGGLIISFVGSVLENALGLNEDEDKDKDQVIFPA
jgi:putative membrane protein